MSLKPRIPRTSPQKSVAKAEQKKERTARGHVDLVKGLGVCAASGLIGPVDPHHLMRGVERGMSMTAGGRYTIPLCREIHDKAQRNGDPEAWLMEHYGLDCRALADALWAVSGDETAMMRAVYRANGDAMVRRSSKLRGSV